MPLRAAKSALLPAMLFAGDVVLLVLFLNPQVGRRDALGLLVALFLPYAIAAWAVLAVVAILATVTVTGRGRSGEGALPVFTWLSFLAAVIAVWLFWTNLASYRHSIPLESVRALATATIALAGSALVLLAAGLDRLLFARRGLSAALVVLASAATVVVPLALRPAPSPAVAPLPILVERTAPLHRVILVGIDGLGPRLVHEGVHKGTLPTLGALLGRGAHGPLATLTPTEGPPVWTSILTGRLPRDHGVKSFATYRLRGSDTVFELLPKGALIGLLEKAGFISRRPVTSASRQRHALWNILNGYGIETGLVRMWGTHPIERVQGFMLSHYFHLLEGDPARRGETLYPPDLLSEVLARAVEAPDVDRALSSRFADLSLPGSPAEMRWREELVGQALAPDLTYRRAGEALRAAYDPPFFATYAYGLDVVGHRFLRFTRPDWFGNVGPEEQRRYGQVLERYASFLDAWLGELVAGLGPRDVLVVVSGYGMRPTPLWRWVLDREQGGGTHADAPDGFVIIVGSAVRPGAGTLRASILDVTPTLLYLMGLPVGRDMEGRVLTEIVEDAFAREHPVSYIPSYEGMASGAAAGPDPGASTLSPDLDLPPLPDQP